jgi:hypothetical protein
VFVVPVHQTRVRDRRPVSCFQLAVVDYDPEDWPADDEPADD